MATSLDIPTAECLAEQEGLVNEGLDIRSLNEEDVSVAEICSFFGPKHSKNGWLYNANVDREQANEILALYRRVTGEDDILNRELTLTFCRRVIGQCKGLKLNWANYGAFLRKYRVGVRNKKASVNRKEVSGFQPHCHQIGSFSLLKTPGSTSLPLSATQSSLVAPKSEVIEGSTSFRGRGRPLGSSKSKVVNSPNMSPNWSSQEIESVREVLATRKSVYEQVKASIEELCELKEKAERELRRARLTLSDRKVIYTQAKLEVDNYTTLLDVAKRDHSELNDKLSVVISYEGTLDSSGTESCEQRTHDLHEEIQKISNIVADRERKYSLAVSEEKFAHERFLDCKQKCNLEHAKVTESTEEFENRSQKLKTLETEVFNFEFQVQRMCEDGGIVTYPLPLFDDLTTVPKKISLVNACPVCNSWYSCNNHVTTLCGHTYHPFCLVRHASASNKCLLSDCEIEFSKEWCTVWGIRAPKSEFSSNTEGAMALKTSKLVPHTYRASSYTSHSKTDYNTSTPISLKNRSSSMDESDAIPWTTHVQNNGNSESNRSKDVMALEDATNVDTEREHASLLDKEKSKYCYVCNDRAPVIRLEACGHSLFCFQCVQGKKTCPICNQKIVGWNKVHESAANKVSGGPLNFNVSSAFNIPTKNLLPPSYTNGGKKMVEVAVRFQNLASEDECDLQIATGTNTKDRDFEKWMEEVTFQPEGPPLSELNANIEVLNVQEEDLQANYIAKMEDNSAMVTKKRGKKSTRKENTTSRQTRMRGPVEEPAVPKKFRYL